MTKVADAIELYQNATDAMSSAMDESCLQRAVRAERAAGTRVEDARFAVLQAILEGEEP